MRSGLTGQQAALFTGREKYIEFFDRNSRACLLGSKGSGKTLFLKRYAKDNSGIYIDLSRLSISPENFAVEYVGTILYSLSKSPLHAYNDFLDIGFLLGQDVPDKAKDILRKIENELQKIKPDQDLLIKLAFSFPEAIDKSQTLVIDEFQEILALNNYAQIGDVLGIFLDTTKDHKTKYKLAGSSINLLSKLLEGRLKTHILAPFDEKETASLCRKLDADRGQAKAVYALSQGHPLVIEALCRGLKEHDDIDSAFINELVYTKSPTHSHLSLLYNSSLSNARGATLLKNILKVMSNNPDLRLSEIARKIYRSSPVTKALLERLIEVDLIVKEGNVFRFSSPLMKTWCSLMFANIEFSQSPSEEEIDAVAGIVFKKEVGHESKG